MICHLLAQKGRTLRGVVDITALSEKRGIERGAKLVEVIDQYPVLLHDFSGDLVVFQFVPGKSSNFALWYLAGGGPDQLGSSFF